MQSLHVLSGYSRFLPQPKDIQVRLICHSCEYVRLKYLVGMVVKKENI